MKLLRHATSRAATHAPVAAVYVVGLACYALYLSGSAQAQTATEFFKGRQLTMLVGGGTGGSVNIYGRMVARHIVRYLPGNPTIVAKNLPAAGGIQAYQTLGSTAPKDGSLFATSARGPLTDPILTTKKRLYDPRKFIWIGSMNDDSSLCFTGPHSKIKTLADARKTETTMAATGHLSESSKFPKAVNAIAGTKFKVITGYRGASGTVLAVEKKEVDGRCTTFGSIFATQPHVLTDKSYNLIMQVGVSRHPAAKDVPTVLEFARNDADKALLKLVLQPLQITSNFVLPEGVPADRVKVWRDAFQKTLRDKQFLAETKKVKLDITPRTGEEVAKIIDDLYTVEPKAVEQARKVFEYGKSRR